MEQAQAGAAAGLSPADALRRAAALHSRHCDDALQFYDALKDELVVALDTWEMILEKTELVASGRANVEAATAAQAVANARRQGGGGGASKARSVSGSGDARSVSVAQVVGLGGADALSSGGGAGGGASGGSAGGGGGGGGDIRSAERLTARHAAAASLRLAAYLN